MLSGKNTILRKSREHLNCLETKWEFSRVNIFFSLVIQHVSNNNTMYYYRQCKTNVSVKLIKEKVVSFFFFLFLFFSHDCPIETDKIERILSFGVQSTYLSLFARSCLPKGDLLLKQSHEAFVTADAKRNKNTI